jgi:hypothetical protein
MSFVEEKAEHFLVLDLTLFIRKEFEEAERFMDTKGTLNIIISRWILVIIFAFWKFVRESKYTIGDIDLSKERRDHEELVEYLGMNT